MRGEIFGDELPGEAGGAVNDDVEFRRRHITEFLKMNSQAFLSLRAKRSNPKMPPLQQYGLLRRYRSLAQTLCVCRRQ
jgi:hypothetical protein